MVRQCTGVMITEGLEGVLEVLLQNTGTNDLLTLLTLRTGLGIVLAHMLVISSTESDNRLFTFVANINSYKHSFL